MLTVLRVQIDGLVFSLLIRVRIVCVLTRMVMGVSLAMSILRVQNRLELYDCSKFVCICI
jgi:hypothetical protein